MAELIFLAPSLFLEVNGVGRYFFRGTEVPEEGLDPNVVRKLESLGHIGPREVEGGVVLEIEIPEGEPTSKWTVAQVDAYALREGIDLAGLATKAEKLRLLADVRETEAAPPPGDEDLVTDPTE